MKTTEVGATIFALIVSGAPNPSRELTHDEETAVRLLVKRVTATPPVQDRMSGRGGVGVNWEGCHVIVRGELVQVFDFTGEGVTYRDSVRLGPYLEALSATLRTCAPDVG